MVFIIEKDYYASNLIMSIANRMFNPILQMTSYLKNICYPRSHKSMQYNKHCNLNNCILPS